MTWKSWFLPFACAAFFVFGCGDDDNPTDSGNDNGSPSTMAPTEFRGTWLGEATQITREVDKVVADTLAGTDTLFFCEEGYMGTDLPGFFERPTASFGCVLFHGDDSISVSCDTTIHTVEFVGLDTCTLSWSFVGSGKRIGETLTLTALLTFSRVGPYCEELGYGSPEDPFLEEFDILATYTRISDTAVGCSDAGSGTEAAP